MPDIDYLTGEPIEPKQYTTLKNRKPMARSEGPKRTPFKKSRKQQARKMKAAKELQRDSKGRTIFEALRLIPRTVEDWDEYKNRGGANRVTNKDAMLEMRQRYTNETGAGECWLCGAFRELDPHHFPEGAARSDELCLIVMACRDCHRRVEGDDKCDQEVLRAKLEHDPLTVDFLRVFERMGKEPKFRSLG